MLGYQAQRRQFHGRARRQHFTAGLPLGDPPNSFPSSAQLQNLTPWSAVIVVIVLAPRRGALLAGHHAPPAISSMVASLTSRSSPIGWWGRLRVGFNPHQVQDVRRPFTRADARRTSWGGEVQTACSSALRRLGRKGNCRHSADDLPLLEEIQWPVAIGPDPPARGGKPGRSISPALTHCGSITSDWAARITPQPLLGSLRGP